jgi:hypothetical protein
MTAAQRHNARHDAIWEQAYETAARAAGWSPTGPHGKWVLAGDKNFSQGSYLPNDRACRYICVDHDLLAKQQTTIPGTAPITQRELAERRARNPLRPNVAQKPCDVGLFSDESAQLDLVDLARR